MYITVSGRVFLTCRYIGVMEQSLFITIISGQGFSIRKLVCSDPGGATSTMNLDYRIAHKKTLLDCAIFVSNLSRNATSCSNLHRIKASCLISFFHARQQSTK